MINHSQPFIVFLQCKNCTQLLPSHSFVFIIPLHPLKCLKYCTCHCIPFHQYPVPVCHQRNFSNYTAATRQRCEHSTHPQQQDRHCQPARKQSSLRIPFWALLPQNMPETNCLASHSLRHDCERERFSLQEDNRGNWVATEMCHPYLPTNQSATRKAAGWEPPDATPSALLQHSHHGPSLCGLL